MHAAEPHPAPAHDHPITQTKRTETLRERTLERVRTDITTGAIPAGTVLSAPALGALLGVSTTPVREAMMDLAADGLVETVKNKGFRVTHMSRDELAHLTQVRLMLEPPAMHLISQETLDAHADTLLTHADSCTTAAQQHDLNTYLTHDRQFHAVLLGCTGNPELVRLATSLRQRTRMYGLTALAESGQLARSSREHHDLIANLRGGDALAAETLMHQHISHANGMWATGQLEDAASADIGPRPHRSHLPFSAHQPASGSICR